MPHLNQINRSLPWTAVRGASLLAALLFLSSCTKNPTEPVPTDILGRLRALPGVASVTGFAVDRAEGIRRANARMLRTRISKKELRIIISTDVVYAGSIVQKVCSTDFQALRLIIYRHC